MGLKQKEAKCLLFIYVETCEKKYYTVHKNVLT